MAYSSCTPAGSSAAAVNQTSAALHNSSQQSPGESRGAYPRSRMSLRMEDLPIECTWSAGSKVGDPGSWGTVYRGDANGRPIAAKVLHSQSSDQGSLVRLALESRVAALIRHPAIVPVLGMCVEPDKAIIFPAQKCSAMDIILEGKKLPAQSRVEMARDAAAGLAVLHSHGVNCVHGDLHVGNILIDDHGTARLSDFALQSVKSYGKLVGNVETPPKANPLRWGAPELFGQDIGPSHSTDVYALGVAIYEMLSCSFVLPDKTAAETKAAANANKVLPTASEVVKHVDCFEPQTVTDILCKMVNTKKELRPSAASIAILFNNISKLWRIPTTLQFQSQAPALAGRAFARARQAEDSAPSAAPRISSVPKPMAVPFDMFDHSLSGHIMDVPVTAADGVVYDQASIKAWFEWSTALMEGRMISPTTLESLKSDNMKAAKAIEEQLAGLKRSHPALANCTVPYRPDSPSPHPLERRVQGMLHSFTATVQQNGAFLQLLESMHLIQEFHKDEGNLKQPEHKQEAVVFMKSAECTFDQIYAHFASDRHHAKTLSAVMDILFALMWFAHAQDWVQTSSKLMELYYSCRLTLLAHPSALNLTATKEELMRAYVAPSDVTFKTALERTPTGGILIVNHSKIVADNVTIERDVTVIGTAPNGLYVDVQTGPIHIHQGAKLTVRNSIFRQKDSNPYPCIKIQNGVCKAEFCEFVGNGGACAVEVSGHSQSSQFMAERCLISSNAGTGISLVSKSKIDLHKCVVMHCQTGVHIESASVAYIRNTALVFCSRHAIRVDDAGSKLFGGHVVVATCGEALRKAHSQAEISISKQFFKVKPGTPPGLFEE